MYMKTLKFIGLLISLTMIEASIYADELKIGAVNITAVLEQSPQKDKALLRLEKEFLSRNKSLEEKHENLRVAQEEVAKDGSILGSDELKAKERRILIDKRDLKRLQNEYSEDLSMSRNEELRKLEENIANTIVQLAKDESYDLVFYQGFIYISDRADITAKVLKILHEKAQ